MGSQLTKREQKATVENQKWTLIFICLPTNVTWGFDATCVQGSLLRRESKHQWNRKRERECCGEKTGARRTMGRGKRGSLWDLFSLFSLPSVPRALCFSPSSQPLRVFCQACGQGATVRTSVSSSWIASAVWLSFLFRGVSCCPHQRPTF